MIAKVELSRETALQLIEVIEKLEIELEAHRHILKLSKELLPRDADFLDESLVLAREDLALLELKRQKYDEVREMLHTEMIDAVAQKAIGQLIQQLRPTDRLN